MTAGLFRTVSATDRPTGSTTNRRFTSSYLVDEREVQSVLGDPLVDLRHGHGVRALVGLALGRPAGALHAEGGGLLALRVAAPDCEVLPRQRHRGTVPRVRRADLVIS